MRKGEATRVRLIEIAEASVLAKGFADTSIEGIIVEASITKSGFFYNFKDKNELAHAMMRRYVDTNNRLFDDIFERGHQLRSGGPQSHHAVGRGVERAVSR